MLTVELTENTNVRVMHIESTSTTFEFLGKNFDHFLCKNEVGRSSKYKLQNISLSKLIRVKFTR